MQSHAKQLLAADMLAVPTDTKPLEQAVKRKNNGLPMYRLMAGCSMQE